jgi:exonuclease VII large subunit
MIRGFDNCINLKKGKVNLLTKSIETHDIQRTLKKGFVLVKQDSKFVTRSSGFNQDKSAILKFYDNELTVLKKK